MTDYEYDIEGRLVRSVTRLAEPEWDDTARGRALRRQEHEDSLDRVTGLPVEVAFNPDQPFAVDTVVNHAHAYQQVHERAERKKAEEKHGGKAPEGWNDGHRYVVRIPTPDELAKDARGN